MCVVGSEVSGFAGEARQVAWLIHGEEIVVRPRRKQTELLQECQQGLLSALVIRETTYY